jgi:hypothetical protein
MANLSREHSSHHVKPQECSGVSPGDDQTHNFEIGFEPIFFVHSCFKIKSVIKREILLPSLPRLWFRLFEIERIMDQIPDFSVGLNRCKPNSRNILLHCEYYHFSIT